MLNDIIIVVLLYAPFTIIVCIFIYNYGLLLSGHGVLKILNEAIGRNCFIVDYLFRSEDSNSGECNWYHQTSPGALPLLNCCCVFGAMVK